MKVAIVTGASSGMGKEFVNTLIRANEEVEEIWVIARREDRLKRWAELYDKPIFRVMPLDLQKQDHIETLRKTLQEVQPEIQCFIHSAGFGIIGTIEEISEEEQLEMVDVNCRSVVALTKIILPYMAGGGRMLYMASAAAFMPQPGFAVYAASKAFVLSFVRSLRRETKKKNLKITAVCPGSVKTEFFCRAAENKHLPSYKKLVMADLKKVVKKAWKDNGNNVEVSVYGRLMKGFHLITKLLPHSLLLKFVKGS